MFQAICNIYIYIYNGEVEYPRDKKNINFSRPHRTNSPPRTFANVSTHSLAYHHPSEQAVPQFHHQFPLSLVVCMNSCIPDLMLDESIYAARK